MSCRAKHELIAAWDEIDSRKSISRPVVREILSLTRILLEKENQLEKYPALSLYCHWAVHWELARNPTAREVLGAISQNFVDIRSGANRTPSPLTGRIDPHSVAVAGLSLIAPKQLRQDLREYYASFGITAAPLNSYNGWHYILRVLLDALVERPLTLGEIGSDGFPIDRRNRKHYKERLEIAGDPQLVPVWLRIDYGARYMPPEINPEQLPTDDAGHTIRALLNGYAWVVHSLPDTTMVILIMDDETRSSFFHD